MKASALGGLFGVFVAMTASLAHAQDSKSAALAKQLAAALGAAKLDSVAAKDPSTTDGYVGALYIPGSQLLVVAAQYAAPTLLDARIAKKEYREVYIELNGATPVATRILIEDLGADGVRATREENTAFDSVELMGKRTMFDSDWKKQNISEQDYMSTFATTDARYVQLLSILIEQMKKGS